MLKALVDGMIINKLMDSYEVLELAKKKIASGELDLLITYIVTDEISDTRDKELAAKLTAIHEGICREVEAGASLWNVGRYGRGPYGVPNDVRGVVKTVLEGKKRRGKSNANDAIIAATAKYHSAVVATEDKELRKNAPKEGVTVMSWEELQEFIYS